MPPRSAGPTITAAAFRTAVNDSNGTGQLGRLGVFFQTFHVTSELGIIHLSFMYGGNTGVVSTGQAFLPSQHLQ